jgi:hypothetical protein
MLGQWEVFPVFVFDFYFCGTTIIFLIFARAIIYTIYNRAVITGGVKFRILIQDGKT